MSTNPLDMGQAPADPLQQQTAPQGPPPEQEVPDQLQKALWRLLMDLETDDEIPRREEVMRILQRRLFFRGEQYWWCDQTQGLWYPPNMVPSGVVADEQEQPAFQHVTNIIQAYHLILASVLSQNNTASQFFPKKASDPSAVQTAKNASKITDLIHRNNDFQNLTDQMSYYMGTDGFMGGFVRYVSDGDRFGHDEHDIYAGEQVPVGPDIAYCDTCGFGAEGTTETIPVCPECGSPLKDEPSPIATVPKYAGTLQIPRGQEVISIVPALQLKRTMYADDQKDFLYMDWITDLHKAIAIATYPEKEAQLSSPGGESDGGAANSYERIARRLLYLGTGRHTGMVLKDLGTFRRAWIRRKAFYSIPGHSSTEQTPCERCQLLELFPEGVHVVFYNDVFCEARNESMDKKWETMHTMPGEGQLRETLTSAMIPAQQQLNDCVNLLFEICQFNVPEGFAADKLLDFEARAQQIASAGNVTPVNLDGPGADIRANLMFTPAAEPSAAMMKYIDMLMNFIPQLLCGASPALFGGDTEQNDTASGISIQRNQALGRIGRAWRRMQIFIANLDAKAVRCFGEHRTEDVEIPKTGESGDYDSDIIRLEDAQGEVTAYPEVESQYPTLMSDLRGLISGLFNGVAANPIALATLQIPENIEYAFRMMGISDLEVPGEQQRKKTYKVIAQLTQEQPQILPPQPPTPEQPQGVPQQMIPSIQPDPDIDDLKVVADTAKKWLISDAGMQMEGTPGYQNVVAYLKAATQLAKAAELKQAIAAQALQGQGPAADLAGAEQMVPPTRKDHAEPPPANAPSGPQSES